MSIYDTDNNMILKTIRWFEVFSEEVRKAGGDPSIILSKMPNDLITTLVRNNLNLVWNGTPKPATTTTAKMRIEGGQVFNLDGTKTPISFTDVTGRIRTVTP